MLIRMPVPVGGWFRLVTEARRRSPAKVLRFANLGNRAPLERRLGPKMAAEFIWVRCRGRFNFYKILRTGRFRNLDEKGDCYAFDGERGYRPSDLELELAKALLRPPMELDVPA